MKRPLKRKLGSFITLLTAAALILFYLINNTDILSLPPSPLPKESCAVHFIDVGQGDCTLITSNGVNVLIDAGENNKGDEVLKKLNELDITSLDYVIGTHAHSDHIGGMDTVLNSIEVKNIILSDLPDKLIPTTKTYSDLLDAVAENEVNLIVAESGKSFKIGEGELTIISPQDDSYTDLNDWSIVTRFVYGETAFLFTGDAEAKPETDILKSGQDISATLLKAGHHGSDTSSSREFLNKVAPQFVVITVGKNNSYGHPHSDALSRFESIGAKIYRTDLDGNITAISNGKQITVTCENEG